MSSAACLILRSAPFKTPPAAAPQDKGRVSKDAPPQCSRDSGNLTSCIFPAETGGAG